MNDASSMGLNASKVIKNIQNNIKLLNRYNFKGGVKGLAKMDDAERDELAERARKLFGFGAGMYIARVLFSKGLIPPIIGGIIGAALLTPSNKPKLNPWGQPFK